MIVVNTYPKSVAIIMRLRKLAITCRLCLRANIPNTRAPNVNLTNKIKKDGTVSRLIFTKGVFRPQIIKAAVLAKIGNIFLFGMFTSSIAYPYIIEAEAKK